MTNVSEDVIAKNNKMKSNAARVSICSNAFLTVSKITAGFLTGSVSVISEGIHSGTDLLASFIAYFSVKKASQPPDADHAFGHGKYEDASGLVEALLIVVAACIIIWEAISKIVDRSDTVLDDMLFVGMIVMGLSAIINFFVSSYLMKVAKATDSIAIESDAWHLRTDVLTSAGIFVALVIIRITNIVWIDSIIAIIVAVFILREATSLIRRSFGDLMDKSLDEADISHIEKIISRYDKEYTNYHGLKTRKAGSDMFIEFHVMMPSEFSLEKAHAVADKIKQDLKSEIPCSNVMIHIDPCDKRCGKYACTFACRDL